MVTRAGPGPYVPPLRNIQPVSLSQRITTIVLTILCFSALPMGWNVAVGLSVLALGFLYPLSNRATNGFTPVPTGIPSFVPPAPPAARGFYPGFSYLVPPPVFYGSPPQVPTAGYTHVASGHQMGPRRPVGGGSPMRSPAPSMSPGGSGYVAGGHQLGDRRPVGGGSPMRGPAPSMSPGGPGYVAGGHQLGDRRSVGGGDTA